MQDALLAAGDGEQLAVERLVPVPVEAGLAEGGIEGRAMAVALGVGERAVDVENQCFQHGVSARPAARRALSAPFGGQRT